MHFTIPRPNTTPNLPPMYTTTQSTAQSTATQEDTVAVIWLFLDKLQPHENARCIYIPRDLFERRSEDCQQLFATELKKKFYFDADVESIEFWMVIAVHVV